MKKPRASIALLALVTVALFGVWAYGIYKAYDFKSDIAEASVASRESAAESSYLSSLRSLLRDERSDIDAVESAFILESDIPNFVSSLEETASATGVEATIGSLTLGSAPSGSFIAPLSVSVSGRGTWQNAMRFVSRLDSLPTASKITSVSLTKTSGGEGAEKIDAWNARIDLVQYVDISKK